MKGFFQLEGPSASVPLGGIGVFQRTSIAIDNAQFDVDHGTGPLL